MNLHSSSICNTPRLQTTQRTIKSRIDKPWNTSMQWILFHNKRNEILIHANSMINSKYYAEWKRPDQKREHTRIIHLCIYNDTKQVRDHRLKGRQMKQHKRQWRNWRVDGKVHYIDFRMMVLWRDTGCQNLLSCTQMYGLFYVRFAPQKLSVKHVTLGLSLAVQC